MPQYLRIPTISEKLLVSIVTQDVIANRPAATGTNGFFFATDTFTLYYDSGSWVGVDGDAPITIVLVNGLNSDIVLPPGRGLVRIIGPSAAFSFGGCSGLWDGQARDFRNTTAFQCTIVNQDGSSQPANQIYTMTGTNVVQAAGNGSTFRLVREAAIPGLVLASNRP